MQTSFALHETFYDLKPYRSGTVLVFRYGSHLGFPLGGLAVMLLLSVQVANDTPGRAKMRQ